jgi:hypothetical protein
MNNEMIVYSFREAIELMDWGRYRCFSHGDYWLNIVFPGKAAFLGSRLVYFQDFDGLKGYGALSWQRVRDELEFLRNPDGICRPPTGLFYLVIFYVIFYWLMLGVLVGRSFLWPLGFVRYGTGLASNLPLWVSFVFLGFLTVIFVILLLSIRGRVKNCDKMLAEKSDELEKLVQDLIESTVKFFREENINSEEYSLRLKFNDYKGLKYLKEVDECRDFVAFLDI